MKNLYRFIADRKEAINILIILLTLLVFTSPLKAQTTTIVNGDYNDDDTWNTDEVPDSEDEDILILHDLVLDKNVNVEQSFILNGSLVGSAGKHLLVREEGSMIFAGDVDISGKMNVEDDALLTIESDLNISAKSFLGKLDGTVLIKSGTTISTDDDFKLIGNVEVTVEEGAVVNVGKHLIMKNNAILNLDGQLNVTKKTKLEDNGIVQGSGKLITGDDEVKIKDNATIFGSSEEEEESVYEQGCIYSSATTSFMGYAGTDWFAASNWTNGVPNSQTPAIISSGAINMPVINADGASCFHLSIQEGASLEILDENNINIYGSFTNKGLFSANQSTVKFVGSCLVTNLYSSGTTTFYNIEIDHESTVMMSSGAIDLVGSLDIEAGSFKSNGSFRIVSNASGTGRIGEISGDAFLGQITMERYIDAGATYWRYISSAVGGATLSQFNDDFTTSGYPGSSYPSFGWVSVYNYDETMAPGYGYVGATSGSQVMQPGEGFQIWSGDAMEGTDPFTFDLKGVPNQGNINLPVSFTATGTPSEDGFCLVGNPYPSTIDWDADDWVKSNMDNAIYIQDPDTKLYATYIDGASANGGSNLIASQQSFWVKANAASPTLTIKESCKSQGDAGFKSSVPNPGCSIKLSGSGATDEAVVRNREGASNEFEGEYDAEKKWGGWGVNPQISLMTEDGEDLTIHSFEFGYEEHEIPVRVIVFSSGVYEIEFSNVVGLDIPCAKLEDTYTGEFFDIVEGEALSFTLSDTSWAPRFLIHTGKNYEISVSDNTCNGEEEGQIVIELGMESVDFDLINVADTVSMSGAGNPLIISDLKSAYYHVEIDGFSDMCGATGEFVILVNQPAPLDVVSTIKQAVSGNDGSVEVEISGGVAPYDIDWSTGSDSTKIENLSNGTYMLMVTDANGCENQNYYKISSLTENVGPLSKKDFIHDALNHKVYINEWKFAQKELILYNAIGQVIAKYRVEIETNTIELDLPAYISKGMYILATPDGEFSEKLMVRK